MTDEFGIAPNILVVDDDKDNVKILETYLKSNGFKTISAYTGQEALQKVNEYDFDLILLDVMLPDTSGYQVCEKIKSTPHQKDIPITMVTALDRIDDKLKSLNLGAEDFLSKPIDEQELLLKVRRQIHNKKTLDKTRREKRELKVLSNILSINYYEKSLEEILKTITVETSLLLESDRTTIFLKSGKFLISKNAQGLNHKPLIIPLDKGICGYVARKGVKYVSNNVEKDRTFNQGVDRKTGYRTKRVLTYPIFHNSKVIGVIQSLNKRKDYTQYDIEMIRRIADHTANILIRFYAEKKLKESERLHRNLMDRLSNAIFTVDNEDRISYVNTAFTRLTGYKPDAILKKAIRILFIPSDLQNLFELGDKVKEIETQIISKDFSLIPVAVTITRYQADNKQSGRIFSIIDLRDKLELEKQQVELEKMRNDFTSMIIHDLKNPLSIIIGFAELLQSNSLGDLNDKQVEFVNKIIQSSEELLNLTNEVLEVSKYEAGKMPLKMSDVEISTIINEVADSQALGFKNKNIEFKEHEIEIEAFMGDPDKLKRLFTNLMSNALKFTPENGLIECIYKVYTEEEQEYIDIEIKDNGVGIPKEDLPNIFSKYKQSEKNQKHTEDKGTGLGLSICQLISEAHDGSIRAESEQSQGTSFIVTLPVNKP